MKEVNMLFSLILRVLVVVIGWLAWGYLIYAFGAGIIPLWENGLAVDSHENVYVGSKKHIQVYSPTGEHLREISAQTDSGYQFKILGDELHINCGETVFVLDLQGNVLRSEEPDSVSWYSFAKDYCTAEDGTQYKIGSYIARKAILVKNENKWMPLVQYPTKPYTQLLICFGLLGLAALSTLSIAYQFKHDKF